MAAVYLALRNFALSAFYNTTLQQLNQPEHTHFFKHIQRGIEKEGLRITPQGEIAQSPHSSALGAPLTHPYITTDYSESLLEFITPVSNDVENTVELLQQLHAFTQKHIGEEYIWPTSMPSQLKGNDSIPIAQYGSSTKGKIKTIYRQGLAHRYGRIMQSIAGIHYNFSMPDDFWPHYQALCNNTDSLQTFKSDRYLGMIRNIQRHSWLLNYLFGASPVLDESFMDNRSHDLSPLASNTLGLRYATSLRMSDLGYQSEAQASLNVSYNSLDEYLDDMQAALQQPHALYQQIPAQLNNEYQQLNSNILQIENEHYSDIRPKRVLSDGETPTSALRTKGIEYIELRLLDINPMLSVGIDATQIRFIDTFLLYCLLADSPSMTKAEQLYIKHNQHRVITQGRDPALQLNFNGHPISFKQAAESLLSEIDPIAALLDNAHGKSATEYGKACQSQHQKIIDPSLTPSGQIMARVKQGKSFINIMLDLAKQHSQQWQLSSLAFNEFTQLASQSIQQQAMLESQIQPPLGIH